MRVINHDNERRHRHGIAERRIGGGEESTNEHAREKRIIQYNNSLSYDYGTNVVYLLYKNIRKIFRWKTGYTKRDDDDDFVRS